GAQVLAQRLEPALPHGRDEVAPSGGRGVVVCQRRVQPGWLFVILQRPAPFPAGAAQALPARPSLGAKHTAPVLAAAADPEEEGGIVGQVLLDALQGHDPPGGASRYVAGQACQKILLLLAQLLAQALLVLAELARGQQGEQALVDLLQL